MEWQWQARGRSAVEHAALAGGTFSSGTVAEATDGVTLMGRSYAPFEHKHDGLAPFRFSVAIENIRVQGYFSKKLVDALLCETVPIYWGAPDVADYFDPGGMIVCATQDEILAAIAGADADLYDAM